MVQHNNCSISSYETRNNNKNSNLIESEENYNNSFKNHLCGTTNLTHSFLFDDHQQYYKHSVQKDPQNNNILNNHSNNSSGSASNNSNYSDLKKSGGPNLVNKQLVLPFIPPAFPNGTTNESNHLIKPSEYLKSITSDNKNLVSNTPR